MQTQTSGLPKIHGVCISDSLFQQRGIFKQVSTFLHKQRCIYIHTRRRAVYTRREMKAVEVCLFVNNQIWRVILEPLCAYVGGMGWGGRTQVWRHSACPNMGVARSGPVAWRTGCGWRRERALERRRETAEFLYGTVLERGVTSLFLASEREREGAGERHRWRTGG